MRACDYAIKRIAIPFSAQFNFAHYCLLPSKLRHFVVHLSKMNEKAVNTSQPTNPANFIYENLYENFHLTQSLARSFFITINKGVCVHYSAENTRRV